MTIMNILYFSKTKTSKSVSSKINFQKFNTMICVSFKSNTMGVTYGTGTDNPSGAPEFTLCFQYGSCCSKLFYV